MAVESYRILGSVLDLAGKSGDAERVLRDAVILPGADAYTKATLGWVLARAGKRTEAEAILDELETLGRAGYVSPAALAILHIGFGNVERALDLAEQAYEDRRGWLVYFKVNPMLDPLRDSPRFQALVAKLKL